MRKEILLIVFTLSVSYCKAQHKSEKINSFLNGIWKMECCDPDFWIYYENKIYWINKENYNDNLSPSQYYCFPMHSTFIESPITYKKIFKKIYLDSVYLDRNLHLIDGSEIIEVLTYQKKETDILSEIPNNGSNFYQLNPSDNNHFFSWYHSSSHNIITYNRITKPPIYVFNYYKKIASERFKRITVNKSTIYKSPNHPTKMHLIRSDEVEIINKTDSDRWYKVRFYGKQTIEGWIIKTDIN